MAIWIHQFFSGRIVMFLSFFRSASDLVGRSSTPCSSPVFRPATRAPRLGDDAERHGVEAGLLVAAEAGPLLELVFGL